MSRPPGALTSFHSRGPPLAAGCHICHNDFSRQGRCIQPHVLRGDAMLGKLVLPEIRELIEAGEDATLRDVVNNWLAPDLGEVVSKLEPDEKVKVLRLLEPRLAAQAFEYLDLETQLT